VDQRFVRQEFPRSSEYHPEWVMAGVSGGANPLWLTEWLAGALDLQPGMRVLDLGRGLGMSSIFLHREWVWATDLWFSATENLGRIRDAGAGLMQEIEGPVPGHLQAWWTPELWCLHSATWWRRHWQRTGVVDIELADTLADGWRLWRDWHLAIAPDNLVEIHALEADQRRYLGYVRVVGRRRAGVSLQEPIVSMPSQYTKKPLLRSQTNYGTESR
jgi:hypothetical protein